MAKIRLAGKKSAKNAAKPGLVPCVIIIVMGIVMLTLLFYGALKSSVK